MPSCAADLRGRKLIWRGLAAHDDQILVTALRQTRPRHLGRDTRSEPQVQGGDDEQAEQRRSDETSQDDDGHRVLDLVAGDIPDHGQGQQACGGR